MAPRVRFNVKEGDVFGQLIVLQEERLPLTPGRAAHGFKTGLRGARCRCSCGAETVVSLTNLRNGLAQSCGCLRMAKTMERLPNLHRSAVRHGLARDDNKHPLYQTWAGMMARCYNQNHTWYSRYGGRGITVHTSWQDARTFVQEITELLGERPDGMTLDRIDNERGYEPGNIRWATRTTQSKNRRKMRRLTLTDEQINEMRGRRANGAVLRELAEEYGVSIATAHRLTRTE
jgi:hypothetical protein